MKILSPTAENIEEAARLLKADEVVAIPTETVYGLAGGALRPRALARIFEAKDRPTFDPLIVHISPNMLSQAPSPTEELSRLRLITRSAMSPLAIQRADRLLKTFWPGPLTIVLPKHPDVPDLATSGLSTVAIRMPGHPVAQAILDAAGMALAAPSANRFGHISPTEASTVAKELTGRVKMVIDGGRCEVGLESTIVAVDVGGELTLLRPGGTPIRDIESLMGCPLHRPGQQASSNSSNPSPNSSEAPQAPGMLASHYAPRKRMFLLPESADAVGLPGLNPFLAQVTPGAPIGLLMFAGDPWTAEVRFHKLTGHPVIVRVLSRNGDPREAAFNLFSEMRALDESEAELLLAEPCPTSEGLGFAIQDRLKRASTPL